MIFADLVAGDSVFLDANTFIYHFTPNPALGPACTQLLQRIENQELFGFTSIHLMGEVAHKLMTIEANALFGWPFAGMANRLRRHPSDVQKLAAFKTALDKIAQSRIKILDISISILQAATTVCLQTGLLINDALIVAMMHQYGWTRLASHDADFDRIAGLQRYSPI